MARKNDNTTRSSIFILAAMIFFSTNMAQASTTEGATSNNAPCSEWTDWIDGENGGTLDPASQGDFELLSQLRGPYGICEEPTDIECRLADAPHTPYDQTGQNNLQCDVETGFVCFHSSQPIATDCFNYEIRVLCPASCSQQTTISSDVTNLTTTGGADSSIPNSVHATSTHTTNSKTTDGNDPSSVDSFYATSTDITDSSSPVVTDSMPTSEYISSEYSTTIILGSRVQSSLTFTETLTTSHATGEETGNATSATQSTESASSRLSTGQETGNTISATQTTEAASSRMSTGQETGNTISATQTTESTSRRLSTGQETGNIISATPTTESTSSRMSTITPTASTKRTTPHQTQVTTSTDIPHLRTDQSTKCPESDEYNCSRLNCSTMYQLQSAVSASTDLTPCQLQNLSVELTNEQRESFNEVFLVCCYTASIQSNERIRRAVLGNTLQIIGHLSVYDNTPVNSETILDIFVTSLNRSYILNYYKLAYIPETSSIIEVVDEPTTATPTNDKKMIAIVLASTVVGLVVVLALAVIFVRIIAGPVDRFHNKRRTPVIERNPLVYAQDERLLMKEWSFGSTPDRQRPQGVKVSGVGNKKVDGNKSHLDGKEQPRWSYHFGNSRDEPINAPQQAYSLPRPSGYKHEGFGHEVGKRHSKVRDDLSRTTGQTRNLVIPRVSTRPPHHESHTYDEIHSREYSGFTL